MITTLDHHFMAQALRLAGSSLYSPHPNPRVGCVLVREGEIVGSGWHAYAGGPHAEVYALEEAGERAAGATAYVTLEPCSHHGRTPPCADALIKSGIARVVAAMQDPNPKVAGRGLARLQAAGIAVDSGLMQSDAEALNRGFIKRMRTGLPWVRCKLAMSLDGRTAMASGESQWITGRDARRDVQRLRMGCAAVLTGIGTVLQDDPSLTVRAAEFELEAPRWPQQARQPTRVILDPDLKTPPQAKLLQQDGLTLIFTATTNETSARPLREAGAQIIEVPATGSGLDLPAVVRELGQREINEVLVEAGATLSGALHAAGLIDELIIYLAPVLLGDGARGLLHLPGLDTMAQRSALQIADIRKIGADWRITAHPVRK
ncbi:MAG: bifunctional diaminohydroxyphosphoribosylaminopyrimidine deaminase/5-amino-6-(5-phosphoribosylamino)uracil reductase RibD [Pseudomonadota bacterium]